MSNNQVGTTIRLLPKQWEVFNPEPGVDYDLKLYQGGFGSGKTFCGCMVGLSVLAKNHGATWLTVADTYSRLKMTTCETYEELLDKGNVRYKHNKTDHTITIPGWDYARVLFKGMDDPTSMRSVNGIGGHIEEASLLSEAAYLEFLGRLRQAKTGDPIRVILTTNPAMKKGWLYEHFVKRAGKQITEIRKKRVVTSNKRVIASTFENTHVSDAFIAAMQNSYDPELFKIVVEGMDGDYTAGLVCKTWSDANIDDNIYYRPDQRLYLSCDFNVDPMSWILFHRVNGEYHFFDELVLENTTTVEAAEAFYRKYGDHEAGVVITGDASGNNRSTTAKDALTTNYTIIRNRLSELGMRGVHLDVPKGNPSIDSRVAAFNAKVCNSYGNRFVKVHSRCKWLIYNCENLTYYNTGDGSAIWKPTTKDLERDPKLKFLTHIFDAASYPIIYFDPIVMNEPLKKPQRITTVGFEPRR